MQILVGQSVIRNELKLYGGKQVIFFEYMNIQNF